MIILGLGSNVGDRLGNLRHAIALIKALQYIVVEKISPVYSSDALLPDNAPAEWDMPFFNIAIRCETSLSPIDLLKKLKWIETYVGRETEAPHWGPRPLDIDILAWDQLVIHSDTITIPHHSLLERPFALWPLADLAPTWLYPFPGVDQGKTIAEIAEKWGSRFTGKAPLHTQQIYQNIDGPRWVGILNVTPDSFSDGGKFSDPEEALKQALYLVYSGAEVLDIGAESTAPTSEPIEANTEWARIKPILQLIRKAKDDFLLFPKISIDTRHPSTAEKALALGADWINDVGGLQDPAMQRIVAESHAHCVVMHQVTIPARQAHRLPRHASALNIVYDWAARHLDRLESAGIARSNIIFDPGIGFGKSPEQSLMLIKHAQQFSKLGTRTLIGHSRKLFLSMFTGYPAYERDIETLTCSLYLANQQVDYLRVHDVETCARGLKVWRGLE